MSNTEHMSSCPSSREALLPERIPSTLVTQASCLPYLLTPVRHQLSSQKAVVLSKPVKPRTPHPSALDSTPPAAS